MAIPQSADAAYKDLVELVLKHGVRTPTRTGIDTLRVTGAMMRISLDKFPLLTTKKVAWNAVVAELRMFLGGRTDNVELNDQNVHIWDGNSTLEFFSKRSISNRNPGDLGPVYGYQWRHFDAPYRGCDANYSLQGIDQLKNAVEMLKVDKRSRQNLVCAWNPKQLDQMALPPCHFAFQFLVSGDNKLDCVLYQRSGDVGLGIPFNIASYGLLTYVIAKLVGLQPGTLVHFIGDAHIYVDHIEALNEQIKREPYASPTIEINNLDRFENVDKFTVDLKDYKSHPRLVMSMAV